MKLYKIILLLPFILSFVFFAAGQMEEATPPSASSSKDEHMQS